MGHLTFRCPKTGTDFHSGFHAQSSDLKDLPKDATINLHCQVCGEHHEFRLAEARVEDKGRETP